MTWTHCSGPPIPDPSSTEGFEQGATLWGYEQAGKFRALCLSLEGQTSCLRCKEAFLPVIQGMPEITLLWKGITWEEGRQLGFPGL